MQYDLSRVQDPVRLAALDRTGLLDSPEEPAFDRLTRIAATLLAAPVSLSTLVTGSRQFFKSQVGLSDAVAARREVPLSHSFCQFVIASEQPLEVDDARLHPILRDNPAIPEMGVVAYLGVPVRAPGGEILGSLCTIDHKPRNWTRPEREQLREIADIVESEIELRLLRRASYTGIDPHGETGLLPGFLQGALDALTTRIAVLDGEGVVLALNEAWREAVVPGSANPPVEDLGRNYLQVLADGGHDSALPEGILSVIRRQLPSFAHEYSLTLDGDVRWYEVRVSRYRKAGVPLVVVAHHDITDLKRAERRLRESEQALRQSRRLDAIGRLAGGISHDFNNLLTAIQGNAEILKDMVGTGDGEEEVSEIRRAAGRASELTRQLLAFGRKQVLQPALVDPGTVILEADRMLRRLIGSNIEMSTLVSPGVGRVQVDPGQLEQVIVNLVLNARDAMTEGGRIVIETLDVELREEDVRTDDTLAPGVCVALRVCDTGPGIPPEFMDRIFEPFFTTKEAGQGTGLGLATCYGIVTQSGGRISVEPMEAGGTCFTVLFPRAAEASPAASEAGDEDGTGPITLATRPGGLTRGTVLLVEDEGAVRRLAALGLRSSGFVVLEAANGEEAVRLVGERAEGIDLLITDVIMPLMGGRELAARLRALRPDLPVLFISGYTGETAAPPGEWAPGRSSRVRYLAKPFTVDELATSARETIGAF